MKHFTSFQSYLSELTIITLLLTLACGQVWGTEKSINLYSKSSYSISYPLTSSPVRICSGGTLSNKNQANSSSEINSELGCGSDKIWMTDLSTGGMLTINVGSGNKIDSIWIYAGRNNTGSSASQFGHGGFSADSSSFSEISALSAKGYDYGSKIKVKPSGNYQYYVFGRGSIGVTSPSTNAETRIYKLIIAYSASTVTKYTLAYDANGGTGSMPAHEFVSGTTVYAAQNAGFTAPSGKIFKCWNTKSDGSGTAFSEGASFTLNGDSTLYAQWITASTGSTYCISMFNLNVSDQMKYFTYSGYDDMYILDLEVPDYKTSQNNFWVGKNGYWYDNSLGNSNAKSANERLEDLCLKGNRSTKLGTASQGVLARYYVYDNSSNNNLYIEFTPKQYALIWGEEDKDWTPVNLYPSGNANEWTSEVVSLTSDHISSNDWKYYVGVLKADNGVAYWYKSNTAVIGTMGTYNKKTDTWGGNVSTLSAGDKGFFRMWSDATGYNNWRCHFVPVYTLSYNANSGSGAPANAYTATEGDAADRTLEVSLTEPTRNGYSFEGWATSSANASAGTVAYAPGASITLSADQELWAVWECVDPTITTDLSESQVDKYVGDASPTLTVAATAAGGSVSYQWYSNSAKSTESPTPTALENCTTATYNPSTAAAGTTYYFCKITNSTAGCSNVVYSKIAKIVVSRVNPTQYTVSGTASICAGGNTDITLSGSQEGASYQLKIGGSASGDAKAGTGSALTWNVSTTGTYTVSAVQTTKYSARDMSGSATVSAKTATSVSFSDYTLDATVDEEFEITGITAAGDGVLTYQWYTYSDAEGSDEDDIDGATSDSYTFTPDAEGDYYFKCEVTGTCGSVKSSMITVTATASATTYTVTYAAGVTLTSGDVPTDSNSPYDSGAEVTVLGNTGSMVYSGYTFRGWTDGTTFYLAGQTFSMPASNVTLTAVWNTGVSEEIVIYQGSATGTTAWTTTVGTDGTNSGFPASSGSSDPYACKWSGTSSYLRINPKTSYSFAAGDSLIVTIYNNNSSEKTIGYKVGGSDVSTTIAGKSSHTFKNVVTAGMISSGHIDLYRYSGTTGGYLVSAKEVRYSKSHYTVSFANQTGFTGSSTLPAAIVGIPSGKKIVQPSDPTASGYEFGGWYSDAACTAGNEINWSTMTITADKTIYAKWCANHTVTWKVNGTTYTTGTPTTATTDCDGIETMPTAPADNTLSCANSFRGWSATNLYGEATNTQPTDLFVTAADAPTINADKTFYAVFGTATDKAYVGTVLWSEDWTGAANNSKPTSPTASGSVVYGEASVSYSWTDGVGTSAVASKVTTSEIGAGGVSPEAQIGKKGSGDGAAGGYLTVSGIPVGGAKTITVEYLKNSRTIDVSYYLDGDYVGHNSVTSATSGSFDIDCSNKSTLSLKFEATTTNTVRLDNIVVKIKEDGATDYRCICPSLEVTPKLVTASTPIFITSAAEKTVRSQDSLLIVGSGLQKNATLSISSPASKFTLKSYKNGDIKTDETGAIDTVAFIYYTPSAGDVDDGLDNNASFTISDGTNSETVSTALIGRHLPANFVIAAKSGDKWYALPANMANGTPDPVAITVNNTTTPDSALSSAANIYSLYGQTNKVITGGNGHTTRLEMHGIAPTSGSGHAPLFGSADNELGRSGNATLGGDLTAGWWWILTQINTSVSSITDVKYNIKVANGNTKPITLFNDAEKWGLYASAAKNVQELRILSWDCTKPGTPEFDSEYPNNYITNITAATADIQWDNNGTAENSNGYEVCVVLKSDGSTVIDWTEYDASETSGNPPYHATGLTASTNYTAKVRAKGATGYCEYSDEVEIDFSTRAPHIIYNANLSGTSGSVADGTATENAKACGYSKENHKFKWWNTAANGSGEDFYVGESVTLGSTDVNLYAQWDTTATNQAFWVGDVAISDANTAYDIAGNSATMQITRDANADWNGDISKDWNQVSKYSSTAKKAKVLAIDEDDSYILINFKDGSPINSLKLGVCNNNSDDKEMIVIYSTTADFSSGVGEKVAKNTKKYDQAKKNVIDFSPSVTGKYPYARIYRRVTTAVYSLTGGSDKTIRIYTIKAEKASGYTISFAGNGNTGGSTASHTAITSGSDVALHANGFTKNGYTFANWTADVDVIVNSATVTAGDPIADDATIENVTSDITLTAQWSANTYTITYNLNGASWASSAGVAEYTVGTGATLPLAGAMTNTGYTFGGWYDNSGLTGSAVTEITTSDYGNKTFWAKWTENTYTITYKKNGDGAGNDGDVTGSTSDTEGHYVTIANSGFAFAGHIFAGWNTAANGSGESYSEGEEIELTANMTLYAIWATDYTISWGIVQLGGEGAEVETPNLGGGNYTITASVEDWTGSLTAAMISSVTEGVTITNVSIDNTSSPKTITATFAIGASVEGESISLELDVPAYGAYGAKSSTKVITIDRCGGSASSTTIFSQDFSTATAVAYENDGSSTYSHTYNTSSTLSNLVGSGTNLFTSIASSIKKGNIAINSSTGGNSANATGFFQVYGNGDNGVYWSINRTADLAATAPTALQVSMDIWYKNLGSGTENGVQFAIGDGFSDGLSGKSAQSTSNVHSGFAIYANSTADLRPYGDKSKTLYSTGITQSTWLSFVWIINNTGSDLTYNNPTGSGTTKLANDKFDLWLKTQAGAASTYTKVISAAAATTASKDLQNIYIGNNQSSSKKHEFRLDNVVVNDISPTGGKVATSLSWDDGALDIASDGVTKEEGDADFTYTASQNKNSLGAITYESSNTSVATVNSTTGKIHIVSHGSTTITATMAESGCYEDAEVTYALTVSEKACSDATGTIKNNDGSTIEGNAITKSSCESVTLKLAGYEAGATIKWYKDGAVIAGATSETYAVPAADEGVFSAISHNTCDRNSSNEITITNLASISATKLMDSVFVKDGRRTPDIPLLQTTDASTFQVKISSTVIWSTVSGSLVTTGLGGCGFYLGSNGIIYMKGTQDDGDAPGDITSDQTLSFVVTDACGNNASDPGTIIIKRQAATTYKEIAFVVDGTREGAWNAVTSGHADGTPLYEYLDSVGTAASARKFKLYEQNIYKTTDEKTLREHYSQFDAILITDDPSTQMLPTGMDKKKTKYKTEGYVNAFGTLIDVRPILTMEAYVSALKNWGGKGIKGDPESPNPRQYEMRLQCKDHEIYSGLPTPAPGTHVWTEMIDGEEYRHVIMVDSTKSPYEGVAYNEQTKGDEKPALQGFSAEAMGDLLGLGVIANGSLHAGIERQEEPAARLMLLGIQNKALPNALTAEGKRVIANALTYLCKTNMEEVDDCSNFFKGGASGDETNWLNKANWAKSTLPNYETRVRILAPCVLSGTAVKVAQVDIASSGTSSKIEGGTCSGSLTIAADAALIVSGTVRSAVAPYFNKSDLMPTEATDLSIEANSSGNGTLIFDNSKGDTKAWVQMYSKAQNSAGEWSWQYVAVPFNDNSSAYRNYYGSWLYRWAENNSGWEVVPDRGEVYPWVGYCLTQASAKLYSMDGTLVATDEQTFTVGNNQDMVIGNSWTAPIQIKQFEDDDFGGLTKNIYLFNTGLDENGTGSTSGERYAAGTYVVIPIHAASYTGDSLISSLQAFTVANTSGSDATLTLNYDKHIRPTRSTDKVNAGQMHAPSRREAESNNPVVLKIWASGSHYDDRLVLLERNDFSTGYDAGWDGEKILIGGASPEMYSLMESGKESVTATDDLEGTIIGFRAGEDSEYIFSFSFDENAEPLYLLDMDNTSYTRILNENTYTFQTTDNAEHQRFVLTRNAPEIITGVTNTQGDIPRARKIIYNDKIYILYNGRIFDAQGKVVK